VDGADVEKSDDKHDAKDMERNGNNDMEKNDVVAVPGVDLGLVLQLRGSEEDRQGLLSDLDNMEIAWEDFILEEPGTTRALVQANLTTRALVQPPTYRPGSRKQSVTSRTSKVSGDSNIIFSKVGGEKGRTMEDQIEPCPASELRSKPCETDSGTVNPTFSENSCDQTACTPPDQLQSTVVSPVNSKDDQILLPEVVKTLIPEEEKTEK